MPVQLHPPAHIVEDLVPRLNTGERQVVDALVAGLSDAQEDWHVVVQPALGVHPDVIVWSADHGVTAIEVKYWTPALYRSPRDGVLEVCDARGWTRSGEDPLAQVHRYRDFLARHIVYRPGGLPEATETYRAVRGCVVLPRARNRELADTIRRGSRLREENATWIEVCRENSLDPANPSFWRMVWGGRAPGPGLGEATASRLQQRFMAHDSVLERALPLPLDSQTREMAENRRGANPRRVRGSAGSGKTVGLAARAARLAARDHEVVCLTYNITLWHYVQDLVRRECRALRADAKLVTCLHFHGFLKQHAFDGEHPGPHPDEWPRIVAATDPSSYRKWPAILVDEGQDFERSWWNLLRTHFLEPGGEMLLVVDNAQDLYERNSWVDERHLAGAGFRGGNWMELKGSHRLASDIAVLATDFADAFLPGVTPDDLPTQKPVQATLPTRTDRRWEEARGEEAIIRTTVRVVQDLLKRDPSIASGDVALLASHRTGQLVCEALSAGTEPLAIEHIFADDEEEQRRRKQAFWPGINAVKGSTIHSFKGWEARALVIVLTDDLTPAADDPARLFYVALTRARAAENGAVHVVNGMDRPAYEAFGRQFENHSPEGNGSHPIRTTGRSSSERRDDGEPFDSEDPTYLETMARWRDCRTVIGAGELIADFLSGKARGRPGWFKHHPLDETGPLTDILVQLNRSGLAVSTASQPQIYESERDKQRAWLALAAHCKHAELLSTAFRRDGLVVLNPDDQDASMAITMDDGREHTWAGRIDRRQLQAWYSDVPLFSDERLASLWLPIEVVDPDWHRAHRLWGVLARLLRSR